MITEHLQTDIKKAVSILKQAGAQKVYIFGSAVNDRFRPDSDIDIGVSGLSPRRFFSVYGLLAEAIKRNIDLVDFDKEKEFLSMLQSINEVKEVE